MPNFVDVCVWTKVWTKNILKKQLSENDDNENNVISLPEFHKSNCLVVKFLWHSVEGKHLTRFQSETSVFKFLRRRTGPLPRVRLFFKKIQDQILKSERVDFRVPLTHHDLIDLGLIRSIKKRKICFRILSDSRIQSWIFLKKRTVRIHLFHSRC